MSERDPPERVTLTLFSGLSNEWITCEPYAYGATPYVLETPLTKAAPELLALAQQYASECAECSGTGRALHQPPAVDHRLYGTCHECADIRAVIAKAVPT